MGFKINAGTRAEALAEGGLVDASTLAKEAGFRIPLALTAEAWRDCVAWPADVPGQDETGRLWDVVFMASRAAVANKGSDDPVAEYQIYRVKTGEQAPTLVDLVLLIGPGDDMEPVCTIYTRAEVEAQHAF